MVMIFQFETDKNAWPNSYIIVTQLLQNYLSMFGAFRYTQLPTNNVNYLALCTWYIDPSGP